MPRVNLVPREEQAREFRRRIYIFPIAGAVLLVGAMGGAYYYYSSQLDNTNNELTTLNQTKASQAKDLAELSSYNDLKSQKQTRLNVVTNLYNGRVRWSRIMDDISYVIPEDIWLNNVTGTVPGTTTTSRSQSAQQTQDFVIDGYTFIRNNTPDEIQTQSNQDGMTTVSIFMGRLTLLPTLTDVTLISAETEKVGTSLAIHFKIGCNLKQPSAQTAPAPTTGETGPSPSPTTTGRTGTTTTPTGTTAGARTGAASTSPSLGGAQQ